jgi:hypothetical protein
MNDDEVQILAAELGTRANGHGPCPVCGTGAIYSRDEDRYLHLDGSDNTRCWVHLSSGRHQRGEPLPASPPRPEFRVATSR